jgi:hypothetical protein
VDATVHHECIGTVSTLESNLGPVLLNETPFLSSIATRICYGEETFMQRAVLILTPRDKLLGLGVLSPRLISSDPILRPVCFASSSFMKAQRIKAALIKARAHLATTEKAAKAAVDRAQSLKKNVREAKRAVKESRRTYKQVRQFAKTASREKKKAEKELSEASERVTKLQHKAEKQNTKAPAARVSGQKKQRKGATKKGARVQPSAKVEQPATLALAQ